MADKIGTSNRVCIVGAGIGGSALAILLAQQGYSVTILEKRVKGAAEPRKQRSINIVISERGMTTIKEMSMESALDDCSVAVNGRMLHRDSDSRFMSYGKTENTHILSLRRSALENILRDRMCHDLLLDVQYGSEVIAFHHPGSLVIKRGQSIKTETFDYIIGADGMFSSLRSCLDPSNKGSALQRHSHSYFEISLPKEFYQEHALPHSVLHLWPNGEFLFLVLPDHYGGGSGAVFFPSSRFSELSSSSPGSVVALMREHFPVLRSLYEIDGKTEHVRPSHLYSVCVDRWHYRNVLLVGDAAHGVLPFLGQGANAALEDALILSELLRVNDGNFEESFSQFVQKRQADVRALSVLSEENFLELIGRITPDSRQANLRARGDDSLDPYHLITFTRQPYKEALNLKRM